jgi:hypothetical protein
MRLKTLFVALFFFAATAAYAQQNNFIIQHNHDDLGVENYTFDKAKNGFKVDSHYRYNIKPKPDVDHLRIGNAHASHSYSATVQTVIQPDDMQLEHAYALDGGYAYAGGVLRNLNNQISNTYGLNKERTQLTQSREHTGKATISTQFPFQSGGLVTPNYDASAIQALVYRATTHPVPNGQYFLIAPTPNAAAESGVVQWSAQQDATGTLDDKPVTVHQYSFLFGTHEYTVYADADNTLMEVDTRHPNVELIRAGFVLDSEK